MIKFADRKEENVVKDVLNTLDRWYIAASGDGCLWIQPRHPVLKLQDFCTLVKRIHRIFNDHRFDVVIFHFDGVEAPRSLWLIILRLLTALAKTVQADCRVIRSIKVNGAAPSGFDRPGNDSGLAKREDPPKRLMKLNGISVVMESRSAGAPLAEVDRRPR